ncbi:MAG: hypothetical protein BWY66_02129 [bacterium ADurb.Bin374]|nr:MAG: hypothetical protein BWY66_02129 [bacterium ADurb.Bin374]
MLESLNAGRNIGITTGQGAVTATTVAAGNDAAMSAQNGNITVSDIAAGNDLSLTGINGNTSVTRSAAGNDLTVSVTNGAIAMANVSAGNDLTTRSTQGNTVIGTANAGGNTAMTVSNGNIEVSSARSGSDMLLRTDTGNVTLTNGYAGQNMTVNTDVGNALLGTVESGYDLTVDLNRGTIDVADAIAGHNLLLKTLVGDIFIGHAKSLTGDLIVKTEDGAMRVRDGLDAGQDSLFISNEGPVYLENVQVSKDIVIKTNSGDISINNIRSENGDVTISTVQNGDLMIENVYAGEDVNFTTGSGGIISGGTIESGGGSVNLIANGPGNINVHEILAKEDVTAQAENGEIVIGQLNGRNVVLGVAHDGERVEVGNTRLEGTMSITADKIFMDHIEHLVDDEYFRLHLKGVQNSAMDDVSIDSINSAAGVQLEGLWSNTAEIHSDCDYFRLRDVYIVDRGYLSNDSLTMTVFGRNPVRDGSDIQAYFVPDAEHPFTQISFQNEFSSLGRECYEILYNTNGNKTPFNQLNMMEECDATVQSEQQALAAARNIFLSPLESAPLNAGISYTSAEIINMAAGVQNGGTVIEGSRIVAGGEFNRTESTMNTSETETNE